MALIGIVQFAEKLLNQAQENDQTQQTNSKQAGQTKAAGNSDGDQFTPSAQNAGQDAGLFHVSNFSIFSAAADFILTEPATAQAPAAGSNGATAQTAGTNDDATNAAATAQAANANAAAASAATQATQQNAAATVAVAANAPTPAATNPPALPAAQDTATNAATTASGAAAADAAADTTAAANAQTELQSLNATLAALGLSPDEITVIDRVAQLINDFNPQAYTDLINQLEALAQAVAPQTGAATTAAQAQTQAKAAGA